MVARAELPSRAAEVDGLIPVPSAVAGPKSYVTEFSSWDFIAVDKHLLPRIVLRNLGPELEFRVAKATKSQLIGLNNGPIPRRTGYRAQFL